MAAAGASKSLYEVLGVDRKATADEIRRAYRKQALVHHPDKGGDPEKFKELTRANEVLSDEHKRAVYDQTGQIVGEDGGANQGGGGFGFGGPGGPSFAFDLNSLFGMFGGGAQGNRTTRRGGKAPSQIQAVPLELKHFYHGHKFGINIHRQIFCKTCEGSGASRREACATCRGQGVQVQVINMGGMTLQTQGPCVACQGKGQRTLEECGACHGQGKSSETKTLDVVVQPGMAADETIVFPEACSEQKEFERPGDVVITLKEAPNPRWRRSGNNLETTVKLNLAESLTGCSIHLEGHPGYEGEDQLWVEIPAGSFGGDYYCLGGFGMPVRGTANGYGDLHIKIEVEVLASERKLLAGAAQEGLLPLFGGGRRTAPDGADVEKGAYLSRPVGAGD